MSLIFAIVRDAALKQQIQDTWSVGHHDLHFYPYPDYRQWEGGVERDPEILTPHIFRNICDWMEACADKAGGPAALRRALAIVEVDLCLNRNAANGFNPAAHGDINIEPGILVAMLILAFPEVHWALKITADDTDELQTDWHDLVYQASSRETSVMSSRGTPAFVSNVASSNIPHLYKRTEIGTPQARRQRAFNSFCKPHFFTGDMSTGKATAALARLRHLHEDGFSALFDPHGLRHYLRSRVNKKYNQSAPKLSPPLELPAPPASPDSSQPRLRVRPEAAASIDEEEAYAYLNAYVAYRFGYRTHLVTTYALMQRLFPSVVATASLEDDFLSQEEWQSNPCQIKLVFEDVYLSFADKHDSLSELATRDKNYHHPGFRRLNKRIIVTAGQEAQTKTEKDNRRYLEAEFAGRHGFIYKPFTGIFDIAVQAGLLSASRLRPRPDSKSRAKVRTQNHFRDADAPQRGHNAQTGHSAPGRLLEIATCLLNRANRLSRETRNIADAVHGALLCVEAEEYLNSRPPTTALEVLTRKQQLEVTAECMFYGVESNIDLKYRMDELTDTIQKIGGNFKAQSRRVSELNAELGIVSELATLFKHYNQFDEELTCLAKMRELNLKVWSARRKNEMRESIDRLSRQTDRMNFHKPRPVRQLVSSCFVYAVNGMMWPLRFYVGLLLSRLYYFFLFIILWVLVLSVFYSWWGKSEAEIAAENAAKTSATTPSPSAVSTDKTINGGKDKQTSGKSLPLSTPGKGAGGQAKAGSKIAAAGSARTNNGLTNANNSSNQSGKGASEKPRPRYLTMRGIAYAVTTFFGVQPPANVDLVEKWGGWPLFITIVAIVVAFIHLGIFVSHLYVMISRR